MRNISEDVRVALETGSGGGGKGSGREMKTRQTGMSSEMKRGGGRRVKMGDKDEGCEGREEKGTRGWRQCVCRADRLQIRMYTCTYTD